MTPNLCRGKYENMKIFMLGGICCLYKILQLNRKLHIKKYEKRKGIHFHKHLDNFLVLLNLLYLQANFEKKKKLYFGPKIYIKIYIV